MLLGTSYSEPINSKNSKALNFSYNPGDSASNPVTRFTFISSLRISNPFTVAVPLVGFIIQFNKRTVEVFPAPFGPSKPKVYPSYTSIESSFIAFIMFPLP